MTCGLLVEPPRPTHFQPQTFKPAHASHLQRSDGMAPKKWSAGVKTVSTYPEKDLFNQDAETVAKHLASKKVSPKGPASGMRMLNFYINRAGKNLSAERHTELEKAKELLSEIIRKQKENSAKPAAKSPKKTTTRKAA
jgi:tRNA(adenine34) deaminase